MIDWLIQLDHDIILGLNALHTPVLDSIMLFLSSSKVWIPLYVLIAALMFIPKWYGRKSPAFRLGSRIPLWLTGLIGVLAVALCFGLTEQITNLVKDWVARPRPSHDPLLEDLLHLPEGRGGLPRFQHLRNGSPHRPDIQTRVVFRRHPDLGRADRFQPHLPGQAFHYGRSLRRPRRSAGRLCGLLPLPVDIGPDFQKIFIVLTACSAS